MEIKINTLARPPQIMVDSGIVSYKEGLLAILRLKDWTQLDMAHYLNMSPRTVEGWIYGRKPSNAVLITLSFMIK